MNFDSIYCTNSRILTNFIKIHSPIDGVIYYTLYVTSSSISLNMMKVNCPLAGGYYPLKLENILAIHISFFPKINISLAIYSFFFLMTKLSFYYQILENYLYYVFNNDKILLLSQGTSILFIVLS
jgi:hypothetical protein